jgi:hypothetical protein
MTEEKQKDIAKEYEIIKKKYSLPELNELDKEFSLGTIESSTFLLRTIMDGINGRIELALKILGNLIQPESHIADMHEAESFSDDEKKKVYELFQRISGYNKEFIIRDFDYSDDTAAALINKFCKDWKILKQDFLRVLSRMKDSWSSNNLAKEEFGYFG